LIAAVLCLWIEGGAFIPDILIAITSLQAP
jgi:hypothetical protein